MEHSLELLYIDKPARKLYIFSLTFSINSKPNVVSFQLNCIAYTGAREGVLCRGCCGGGGGSQFLRINITPNRNRKSCYSLRTFMRSC